MEGTLKTTAYNRIAQAINYISTTGKQLALDAIAEEVASSPFHFQRQFSEMVGISPKKFQEYLTLQFAKDLLLTQRISLAEVAEISGLSSPSRLYDFFIHHEATSPGTFKQAGKGSEITYTLNDSKYGRVLIANTNLGICNLEFVNSDLEARQILNEKWPMALVSEKHNPNHTLALNLINQIATGPANLHLHIKGTAFQLKVWETLLKLPEGQVATYQDIANLIGEPLASRAVGTAIGANPVAVLIPCHRVLRKEGAIGGYHWGPNRKLEILCTEQMILQKRQEMQVQS